MKNIMKIAVIGIILFVSASLFSQTPPHPNGGNAPGGGNTPVGGGAPIDGGFSIMLLLAAAYGIKGKLTSNVKNNS